GVTYSYPTGTSVSAPYDVTMKIYDPLKTGTDPYRTVKGTYDGLGRMLQTKTHDDDANADLITTTDFNAQGLAYQQSLPYYPSGTPQYTTTTYDALGRAVQVTAPGDINTYTSYDGLTTTITDPNGNKTARTTDGMGRLALVQEYNGSSVYATTRYTYDAADRLTTTTDAQSNVTHLSYDLLGRKTLMQDPDMGQWSYTYDAINLTQQTDANGNILQFRYDALNRLQYKDDITSGTINLLTNIYGNTATADDPGTTPDESAANNVGMRTNMSDRSGATAWTYSNYGRKVEENKTIGSVTAKSTTESDWLGRVLRITYPDTATPTSAGEVVTYHYDALGRAKDFSSDQSGTLAELAYNALSQINSVYLGGMQANHAIAVTNQYDAQTNRLKEHSATSSSGTLMDFSYLYDQSGNITRITDSKLNETQTYQYDFLNRLTSAQSVTSGATPTVQYNQGYEYDQVGNITKVRDLQNGEADFKDDFEDATLSTWSSVVQGGPTSPDIWNVWKSGFTPVLGNYSLLVEINDNNDTYVQNNLSSGQSSYRARFYFNPNSIALYDDGHGGGDSLVLFNGNTSSGSVLKVTLHRSNGVYQVRESFKDNNGTWQDGDWYTIANKWNVIEVDWQAGTSGTLGFWLNGIFKQVIGPVDNSGQQLTQARLGAMNVSIQGVSGDGGPKLQILFDAFESRTLTYIGPVPQQVSQSGTLTYPSNGQLVSYHDAPLQDPPTDTATSTLTPTYTPTVSIIASLTPTITPTPTKTPSDTPTPGFTPTRTPTATKTPSNTPTPSNTSTPSVTPSVSKTPTPVTPSLVAQWSFDETNVTPGLDLNNDAVSSNGTPIGAHTQGGFYLHSIEFDTSTQYVNVPRKAELEPANGFTLSAWIYPFVVDSGDTYVIMNKGGTSQDYRLYI
ncbi:MAG TPA: hypothetical protein VHM28_11135, partial [Anaerolineales bacterium]|nr:hypothetical protein [Anaerolineales bacterium]